MTPPPSPLPAEPTPPAGAAGGLHHVDRDAIADPHTPPPRDESDAGGSADPPREWLWRLTLPLATIVCVIVAAAAARLLSLPEYRGRSAGLLGASRPLWTLLGAGMTLGTVLLAAVATCVLIARPETSRAGRRRDVVERAFAAAALGMAVWAYSVGPVRFALLYADGRAAYAGMLAETLLLTLTAAAVWWSMERLRRHHAISTRTGEGFPPTPDATRGVAIDHAGGVAIDDAADPPEQLEARIERADVPDQQALGLIVASLVTLMAATFLARSDAPSQTLFAAFLSAAAGAACGHGFVPATNARVFWPAPLLAGAVAYAFGWLSPSAAVAAEIGRPAGYFAAAAHVTPLVWATAGIGGAIVGVRLSRRWRRQRREADAVEHATAGMPI